MIRHVLHFPFGHDWYAIAFYLALFALCLATPFKALFKNSRRFGRRRIGGPLSYMVIFPVVESAIFWFALFPYLLKNFAPLVATIMLGTIYAVYSMVLYGTVTAAESLIIGLLFGLALIQFGLLPVVAAHILYRMIYAFWA